MTSVHCQAPGFRAPARSHNMGVLCAAARARLQVGKRGPSLPSSAARRRSSRHWLPSLQCKKCHHHHRLEDPAICKILGPLALVLACACDARMRMLLWRSGSIKRRSRPLKGLGLKAPFLVQDVAFKPRPLEVSAGPSLSCTPGCRPPDPPASLKPFWLRAPFCSRARPPYRSQKVRCRAILLYKSRLRLASPPPVAVVVLFGGRWFLGGTPPLHHPRPRAMALARAWLRLRALVH